MEHGFARTNGIRMHYVAEGRGPLVILLHGFPEFWYSWRHQLPALAGAGLCAVAPDLRGWGETEKPKGVAAYRIEELAADVDGLRAALGAEQIYLVGHDWGGAIAWWYAARYPMRVRRLAILNVPHPRAFGRVLRRSARQRRMSWYIAAFQIPWLPETIARLTGYAAFRKALVKTVNPDAMTDRDVELYMENIRRPGALTAGVNYYRAARKFGGALKKLPPPACPSLLIWGEQDAWLDRAGAEESQQVVPGLDVRYLPGASHWVQVDAPEKVNQYLLDFFAAD